MRPGNKRSAELAAALLEVRRVHQSILAPAKLEAALREAVRRRTWRWRVAATLALAASLALAILLLPLGHPQEEERLSSFVALPSSSMLPAPAATSVFRIQIRKEELRQYGLDVPPPMAGELVQADFVVGEDGLARAIRFVL